MDNYQTTRPNEDRLSPLKAEPNWLFRRSNVFIIQLVCAGILLFLTFKGEDTRLNETLANGAYMLWGTIAIGYIFGVIMDDKFQISKQRRESYERYTQSKVVYPEDQTGPPPKNFAG